MKKFYIEWETDYCDEHPEDYGDCEIIADTEDEAVRKFYKTHHKKAIIISITESEEF